MINSIFLVLAILERVKHNGDIVIVSEKNVLELAWWMTKRKLQNPLLVCTKSITISLLLQNKK